MAAVGYVICDACGSRVKANRKRCPRCEELLVPRQTGAPAEDGATGSPVALVGVAAVVIAIGGASIWMMRSGEADVFPVKSEQGTAAPAAVAPSAVPAPVPMDPQPLDRATNRDINRSAGVAFASADFDAARASYEQALQRNPDDPEALNGLGQALVRLGKVSEALGKFERAVQAAPETWAYRFNLAHAVGQLGNWDRAATEYRAAAQLFPTDYATQYNLAMALHKKGDEQAAVPEFRKAIELAPSEPTFRLSLGISLEKLGKISDAIREYQAFLEMAPAAADAAKLKAHVDTLLASASAATRSSNP